MNPNAVTILKKRKAHEIFHSLLVLGSSCDQAGIQRKIRKELKVWPGHLTQPDFSSVTQFR